MITTELLTRKCPFCAEEINAEAVKCKHCGELLDPTLRRAAVPPPAAPAIVVHERKWSPGVAAVLSLFIPGLGQLYKSQVGAGFLWFIGVVVGYALLIVPGLVLHLLCIISAASGDPYK